MRFKTKSLAAALILSAALFTGCGETEEVPAPTPVPTATTAPTAVPTATETPTLTPTPTEVPKSYEIPREFDEAAYLYVNDKLSGIEELTVDVSQMACYKEGALYQVTLLKTDGTFEEMDLAAVSGKISFSVKDCVKAEVSPIFRFVLGKRTETPEASEINVVAKDVYSVENLYGFYGTVENLKNGVHLKGSNVCFIAAVPDGFYNVNITKYGTGRSLVCINGEALGCNVGIDGSGRTGIKPYDYYMEDAFVTGGTLRVSLGEKDYDLSAVEIRRSPTIRPRKPHLYLAGDSTCSAYYPIETEIPKTGTARTGWGQVLNQFLTVDVAITNLGAGGTYAKSWCESAFGGVLQNAQPGDYFIIMHGINDQSYSSVEEMRSYLTSMIDACREKGIIPVLCTPMQTAKFWRSGKGKDLGEFEAPEGGGKVAFMDGIRALAKEKGVFLIDVASITSEQYGILGKTFVTQNFHLYNSVKGTEEDTLHLSYAGAVNVASVIATELYKLRTAGTTDATGAVITGLTFNPMSVQAITYTDQNGNECVLESDRIECIYRRYNVRE